MSTFELECFQNEYLPAGGHDVNAIVRVTCADGTAPETAAAPEGRAEVIIIDTSGSMHGRTLQEAKRAAATAIDCITDGTRFAVIAGNHLAQRIYPTVPGLALEVASPTTKEEAMQALWTLGAGGGTCIGAWLFLATDLLRDQEGINHAILLTDGVIEGEGPEVLDKAIAEATGLFQCDCRGVGTHWSVAELRKISTALLGTVDIVATPDDLADDFLAMMRGSMSKNVGSVDLRLWTPQGATIRFVKQVAPDLLDLTPTRRSIDERTGDYATGAWGAESRDFHVGITVRPAETGDEMLACRVTLRVGDESVAQHNVRAVWTEDAARSTKINRQVAHYTGQADLADAIQNGLEALEQGDLDMATDKLQRAVLLADESGNAETATLLAKVVDVEPATGLVRIRRDVKTEDLFTLDTRSTKTSRVD